MGLCFYQVKLTIVSGPAIDVPLIHVRCFDQVKLTIVSGPAIDVPLPREVGGPVDEALVTLYLERYKDALRSLFDRHKAAAGMPDRQLVIV